MKKLLKAAAICAALASTSSASAAELLFDFVGLDPADNFSFTLDSNPDPFQPLSTISSFVILDQDVTTPNGTVLSDLSFLLGDPVNHGGVQFSAQLEPLFGPQLFTGTTENPTFLPGSFDLAFLLGEPAGTLTIGSASTAAVPEPGTWLMLLLGFGAMGAMMRGSTGRAKNLRVRYSGTLPSGASV